MAQGQKVSQEIVNQVFKLARQKIPQTRIAKTLNLSRMTVSRILAQKPTITTPNQSVTSFDPLHSYKGKWKVGHCRSQALSHKFKGGIKPLSKMPHYFVCQFCGQFIDKPQVKVGRNGVFKYFEPSGNI